MAAAVHFAHQMGGNQEAGDGKEDVNTDVAATDQLGPIVKDDDGRDGDCAQRLNLGPQQALLFRFSSAAGAY